MSSLWCYHRMMWACSVHVQTLLPSAAVLLDVFTCLIVNSFFYLLTKLNIPTALQRHITQIYQHMFYNLKVFSHFYCLGWCLWAIFRCSLIELQYLFAKDARVNMFSPLKLFHLVHSLNGGITLLFSQLHLVLILCTFITASLCSSIISVM